MERKWTGTTYGSHRMLQWLICLLKHTDVRVWYVFAAIFVIPVCLLLNSSSGIIYRYFRYQHGYGILKSALKTYTNHCLFGQMVIDKFAMYAGKRFHIAIEGGEYFQHLADKPESFLQLSSHIGNYEIAGYTLKAEQKAFNALVFSGEKAMVMENRAKLFNNTNIRMIAIRPDMGHLFEIDAAIGKGEIISMTADRILGSQKKLRLKLLHETASFPYGPFNLAAMHSLNVIAVHVVKTSLKSYKIYVTPLTYDKEAPRKKQVEELAGKYVAEVEQMLRRHPAQWFNYFEFWEDDERQGL